MNAPTLGPSNGLDDLRRTLDAHAHDLSDTGLHARGGAVRGRVRVVRRRRAAGVALASVLAIGTATGVALLPGGPDAPQPAPPGRGATFFGEQAPPTIESLGWTYRFAAATVAEDDAEGGLDDVTASDRPRLVSWMTEGEDQDVRVLLDGERPWVSSADDFTDFAWVPPGYEGDVRVVADEPGVAVVMYEVDAAADPPAGVSRDGVVLRDQAGDRSLVGGVVGRRGETDLSFDFTVPETTLSVAHTCSGLPRGSAVHISMDGSDDGVIIGSCEEDFDPGASPSSAFPDGIGVPEGAGSRARIWVTKGMEGDPVDPADFPDAQLGLGLYAFDTEPELVAGTEVPRLVESRGRLWQYSFSASVEGAPAPRVQRRELPVDDGPWLVTSIRETTGTTRTRMAVEGATSVREWDTVTHEGGGSSSIPETYLPRGTTAVSVQVVAGAENVSRLGLAFYRLIG